MADYRLSKLAESDLIAIFQYGQQRFGIEVAERYYWSLFEKFAEIALAPRRFPDVGYIRKGYRRAVHRSHSIYYRESETGIDIMTIINAQDIDQRV